MKQGVKSGQRATTPKDKKRRTKMLEMVLLLVASMALVIFAINAGGKHKWFYIVDNLTINECRKFDNVREAMEILELCRQDGHEVYLKRLRV